MMAVTTQLNTPGPELSALDGVHALTDVTGFGLAGHALELARGAQCEVQVDWARVPLIEGVHALASAGMVTGASGRNWAAYGEEVKLPLDFGAVNQALLSDPQTSGGLMVTCAAEAVDAVLALFARHGFGDATEIGRIAQAGASGDASKLLSIT
jgi:selenide,water dikinase